MRIVFLAQDDAIGLVDPPTLGAIAAGDFAEWRRGGHLLLGRFAGVAFSASPSAVGRALLPSGVLGRTIVFTLGTTAFMVGQIRCVTTARTSRSCR